jgi:hypothetical protein
MPGRYSKEEVTTIIRDILKVMRSGGSVVIEGEEDEPRDDVDPKA